MPTHRISVNVPNPRPTGVLATLRIEPAKPAALRGLALDLPEARLKVITAGLSLDPCSTEGARTLRLTLKPYSSVDVQVVVITAATAPGKPAMAAFHLIDERAGQPAGGVTVACVTGAGPEPAGVVVTAANPCPAIATVPYPVPRGADPSQAPAVQTIPLGAEVDLVVPIRNPTRTPLAGVEVYLEHLGRCDAQFTPVTWNVGTLRPKEVFYATWPLSTSGWMTGAFDASVVVVSKRKDSVRLAAPIRIGMERLVTSRRRRSGA